MKKVLKYFSITFIFLVISIAVLPIVITQYSKLKWKSYLDEDQIKEYAEKIEISREFPEIFYQVYDELNPKKRNRNLQGNLYAVLWNIFDIRNANISWPFSGKCVRVFKESNKELNGLKGFILKTIAIEELTTQDKCFDFYYNRQKMNEYSKELFEKNIEYLNKNEIKKLLIFFSKPTFYRKNPGKLERKI